VKKSPQPGAFFFENRKKVGVSAEFEKFSEF
jgi:hypothetical protein